MTKGEKYFPKISKKGRETKDSEIGKRKRIN
jgi:hypothetical protein